MKLINFFRILVLSVVVSGQSFATILIDYTAQTQGVLNRIEQATNSFTADITTFNELSTLVTASYNLLVARENQRAQIYADLVTKFNAMVADVNNCISNKQAIIDKHAQDVNDLSAAISTLTACTESEIASLNAVIAGLNEQIATLTVNINTFVNLTQDKVEDATAQLQAAKAAYLTMVTSREAFLTNVDSLIDKVNAYNYLANTSTSDIANLICNS